VAISKNNWIFFIISADGLSRWSKDRGFEEIDKPLRMTNIFTYNGIGQAFMRASKICSCNIVISSICNEKTISSTSEIVEYDKEIRKFNRFLKSKKPINLGYDVNI
jgi:hypothetical protein